MTDQWIINRITWFNDQRVLNSVGEFEQFITDRIMFPIHHEVTFEIPAGKFDLWLTNQISRSVMESTDVSTGYFNILWDELAGTFEEEVLEGLPSRRAANRGIMRGIARGIG